MNYWRGYMSWPLDKDWVCETCGEKSILIWGFVHGVCRCNTCHTQYDMGTRDKMNTVPVSRLKEEYKESAKCGWLEYNIPISEWTDGMWEDAGVEIGT